MSGLKLVEPMLVLSRVCACSCSVLKGVMTFAGCGDPAHDEVADGLREIALEAGNPFHYEFPDGRVGQHRPCGCHWAAREGVLRIQACQEEGHAEALVEVLTVFARDRGLAIDFQEDPS